MHYNAAKKKKLLEVKQADAGEVRYDLQQQHIANQSRITCC